VHYHSDNKWYTGEVHSTQSVLLTPFDAITYKDLFEPLCGTGANRC